MYCHLHGILNKNLKILMTVLIFCSKNPLELANIAKNMRHQDKRIKIAFVRPKIDAHK
jgi:hypothetical protein